MKEGGWEQGSWEKKTAAGFFPDRRFSAKNNLLPITRTA